MRASHWAQTFLASCTCIFTLGVSLIVRSEPCPDLAGYNYGHGNYENEPPRKASKLAWKVQIASSTNIEAVNLSKTLYSLHSRGYFGNTSPDYTCKIAYERIEGGHGVTKTIWYCKDHATGKLFKNNYYFGLSIGGVFPDKNGNPFVLYSEYGNRESFRNNNPCTTRTVQRGVISKVSSQENGPLLPFLLFELMIYPLPELQKSAPQPSF